VHLAEFVGGILISVINYGVGGLVPR